jgi:cytochrome c peroxidase
MLGLCVLSVACQQQRAQGPVVAAPGAAFFTPHAGGNGRSCATCHVEADHFTLSPATVQAKRRSAPDDPLFQAIDADDPTSAPLTYAHLERGLIRRTFQLPPNVDLIAVPPDDALTWSPDVVQAWWDKFVVKGARLGDSLPPPELWVPAGRIVEYVPEFPLKAGDRAIHVWRGVPSILNTAYTAPFLLDGRAETLEEQAAMAMIDHGLVAHIPPEAELRAIAAFQERQFSSSRAEFVASALRDARRASSPVDLDAIIAAIPDPEKVLPPTGMKPGEIERFARGKKLYDDACTACHGRATDNRIINREVARGFFTVVGRDGNVTFVDLPGVGRVPATLPDATIGRLQFIHTATPFFTYLSQITRGQVPAYTQDVTFPKYRLRFYADGTRARALADLPPLPARDVTAATPFVAKPDGKGGFVAGPNFAPQLYTPDPGRALVTGRYWDFEAFDVPQLRGIARTAPYFHDNRVATLAEVVDFYSRNMLPFIGPMLGVLPADGKPTPGVDVLSPEQKADLVFFLEIF